MVAQDSLEPLSGSVKVLYAIYLEIAKRDHRLRVQALYGKQNPPPGHTPLRPLPLDHFVQRLQAAQAVPGGEETFRRQLARWAKVYGVDCLSVVSRRLAA